MKRILAVILSVCCTLTLMVGCSGKDGKDSSQSNSDTQKNTEITDSKNDGQITIMGNARMYDGEEDAWNEVAQAFENETGIKVIFRWQGKWNEVPQNLTAARMANESVDLVTVGAGLINSSVASSGMLMDMTDIIEPFRDKFKDGMLDAYTIGGKVWGFPYGNSASSFIYYNKDIFDKLGISEVKTYDELVDISKTIADAGYMPMIYRGKDVSYWPGWFFSTFAQTTGNKSVDTIKDILSGKRSFVEDDVINALADIKPFFDDGIVTSDSFDTNGDGMKATFFQQKAAMLLTHNFQILPNQCDFNLGIMEFPLVVPEGQAISQPSGGAGTGIAIPSFADRSNLDNTKKFLEFLFRPENANKIISCYHPVVDVIKGVNVLDEPIVKELVSDYTPKTVTYLDWIWPAKVQDAFCYAIPAVITGEMQPKEAAEYIQASLDDLVKNYDYTFDWWTKWTDNDWKNVTP